MTVIETGRDVPVQGSGPGNVKARTRSRIGFEVGGALPEPSADQGERIARAALPARLCSAPFGPWMCCAG